MPDLPRRIPRLRRGERALKRAVNAMLQRQEQAAERNWQGSTQQQSEWAGGLLSTLNRQEVPKRQVIRITGSVVDPNGNTAYTWIAQQPAMDVGSAQLPQGYIDWPEGPSSDPTSIAAGVVSINSQPAYEMILTSGIAIGTLAEAWPHSSGEFWTFKVSSASTTALYGAKIIGLTQTRISGSGFPIPVVVTSTSVVYATNPGPTVLVSDPTFGSRIQIAQTGYYSVGACVEFFRCLQANRGGVYFSIIRNGVLSPTVGSGYNASVEFEKVTADSPDHTASHVGFSLNPGTTDHFTAGDLLSLAITCYGTWPGTPNTEGFNTALNVGLWANLVGS